MSLPHFQKPDKAKSHSFCSLNISCIPLLLSISTLLCLHCTLKRKGAAFHSWITQGREIKQPSENRCEWDKNQTSCLTLCDPMDCSLPGSSVHGILQARILEWVAISFFPGDLPDPGVEPRSPALQEDSSPSGLWGNLTRTQLKGQIREGLEIWQVSHSALNGSLTHFYSSAKINFGEVHTIQTSSNFYGKA